MSHPPPRERLLAGPHNTRLGPAIHSFNLPADPDVCVGASPVCAAACYARSFLFRLQHRRHRRNFDRSRGDGFAAAVAAEVRDRAAAVVRVHAAGDFYHPDYVAKWARVARACPETTFFAYTRSWRDPDVLPALADFARLPNVWLWFSEDPDTGPAPAVPGVRRAYLLGAGEPEAAVPPDADLVFRVPLPRLPGRPNAYERPAKRVNGVLVCPKEQGTGRGTALTCSRCRICLSGYPTTHRPARRDHARVRGHGLASEPVGTSVGV